MMDILVNSNFTMQKGEVRGSKAHLHVSVTDEYAHNSIQKLDLIRGRHLGNDCDYPKMKQKMSLFTRLKKRKKSSVTQELTTLTTLVVLLYYLGAYHLASC